MTFKGRLIDFLVRSAYRIWEWLSQSRVFRRHLHGHLRDAVLPVIADGNVYIVKRVDDGIGRMLYVEQRSEELPLLEAVFAQLGPNKPKNLIDIGANYGTTSISALRSGVVQQSIGFEPDPFLASLARCNGILNGLAQSFEIRNLALGSVRGTVQLEISDLNSGDNRIHLSKEPGMYDEESRRLIEVSQSTLDDEICTSTLEQSIVFCDVQGYEGHVLQGAKSLLEIAVPLVLEFWPYGLARVDGFESLKGSLASSGYKRLKVLESGGEFEDLNGTFLDDLFRTLGMGSGYANLLLLRD